MSNNYDFIAFDHYICKVAFLEWYKFSYVDWLLQFYRLKYLVDLLW